jgi:hypothetical protein
MLRLALSIFGISTVLTACVIYRKEKKYDPSRRVPVKEAAAMLQEAWSDAHTRA